MVLGLFLRAGSRARACRSRRRHTAHAEGGDPSRADPVHQGTRLAVPRRRDPAHVSPLLQLRRLARPDARLCGANQLRPVQAPERSGTSGGRRIGQAGVEAASDQVLFTVERAWISFVSTRSGRPTAWPLPLGAAETWRGDPAHDRYRSPARGRAFSARLRHQACQVDERRLGGKRRGTRRHGRKHPLGIVRATRVEPHTRGSGSTETRRSEKPLVAGALANNPVLNRAIRMRYPPARPQARDGTRSPRRAARRAIQPILCSGSYTVKTIYGASQTFSNWNPFVNQWMTMPTALAQSCDTYFYQATRPEVLGPPRGSLCSGGRRTPSASAARPESTWARKTPVSCRRSSGGRRQYTRKTIRTTGGSTLSGSPATRSGSPWPEGRRGDAPCPLARFYAMIANGGKLVTPHVVADVKVSSPDKLSDRPAGLSAASGEVEWNRPD